jgi:hypothetical protein
MTDIFEKIPPDRVAGFGGIPAHIDSPLVIYKITGSADGIVFDQVIIAMQIDGCRRAGIELAMLHPVTYPIDIDRRSIGIIDAAAIREFAIVHIITSRFKGGTISSSNAYSSATDVFNFTIDHAIISSSFTIEHGVLVQ